MLEKATVRGMEDSSPPLVKGHVLLCAGGMNAKKLTPISEKQELLQDNVSNYATATNPPMCTKNIHFFIIFIFLVILSQYLLKSKSVST